MAKKVLAIVKIHILGGQATPAPPVGTALGPHGVNIMEFCKAFNERTKDRQGAVVPIELTIYEDRSFSFITKTPPAATLLKDAVGVEKGSGEPQKIKVATVSRDKVREIAKAKMPDLNAANIEAAMRIIEGTARSMGIEVGAETSVNEEAIAQLEEAKQQAQAEKAQEATASAGEQGEGAAGSEPAAGGKEGAASGGTKGETS